MTRFKVCEFSNNFQRECKLEVEALYRRTDYIISGQYLTVMFQSAKTRNPTKIWDLANKFGSNRKLDLSRPEVEN